MCPEADLTLAAQTLSCCLFLTPRRKSHYTAGVSSVVWFPALSSTIFILAKDLKCFHSCWLVRVRLRTSSYHMVMPASTECLTVLPEQEKERMQESKAGIASRLGFLCARFFHWCCRGECRLTLVLVLTAGGSDC